MRAPTMGLLVLGAALGAPAAQPTPSGEGRAAKFPGSKKTADLDAAFRPKAEAFVQAARDAGATVDVTSTLRPRERAYLMHRAWMIAKKDADPRTVPALAGVDITWWHGSKEASKKAAQEMVDAFGVGGLRVAPALASRHTEGDAVDTQVRWAGR